MKHMRNLFGYFLAATLVVAFAGIGAEVAGSIWLAIAASAVVASIALVGGIFVTMIFRTLFKLVQTGRILQYAGFWLTSFLGLKAAASLFATALFVTNPLLASFVLFALAFGSATICGEVPMRGRTWLPVKSKR